MIMGFPSFSAVKNPPANGGGARDSGLIPGSGRSPGEGNGKTYSTILTWEIPWTEEPGGLQSMGSQKSWKQLSNYKTALDDFSVTLAL